MHKHALHKVRDLPPDAKHTVEILLGQVLQDDEATIMFKRERPCQTWFR